MDSQMASRRLAIVARRNNQAEPLSGPQIRTAVDEDDLPLNEFGGRRGEPEHEAGVVRIPDASPSRIVTGGRSNDVARLRAEHCPDRVGLDDSWRNCVDPDTSRRELDREGAHQTFGERPGDAD